MSIILPILMRLRFIHVSEVHSFLLLSTMPVNRETTVFLSIHWVLDIWFIPDSGYYKWYFNSYYEILSINIIHIMKYYLFLFAFLDDVFLHVMYYSVRVISMLPHLFSGIILQHWYYFFPKYLVKSIVEVMYIYSFIYRKDFRSGLNFFNWY